MFAILAKISILSQYTQKRRFSHISRNLYQIFLICCTKPSLRIWENDGFAYRGKLKNGQIFEKLNFLMFKKAKPLLFAIMIILWPPPPTHTKKILEMPKTEFLGVFFINKMKILFIFIFSWNIVRIIEVEIFVIRNGQNWVIFGEKMAQNNVLSELCPNICNFVYKVNSRQTLAETSVIALQKIIFGNFHALCLKLHVCVRRENLQKMRKNCSKSLFEKLWWNI